MSSPARKIVLPGGSGFLGRQLAAHFASGGDEVVVLSRDGAGEGGNTRFVRWDGAAVGAWAEELEGAAAVMNLAGRSVNCRYNAENRRAIYESRLNSTR